MDRLAILFGRHRVLLTCCVSAYTVVCLFGLTLLRFDNDPLRLLRSEKFEIESLDGDFAGLERNGLIVVEGDDMTSPAGVEAVRKLSDGAAGIQGVKTVYSMLNVRGSRRVGRYLLPLFPSRDASPERFDRARAEAASHPILVGQLLSRDLTTALVVVQLEAWVESFSEKKAVVGQLQDMLSDFETSSAFKARLTGIPPLSVEIVENMRADIFKFSTLGATLVFLIAMFMFRRAGAALLVGAGPTVGAIWTVGTLGLLGEPINVLTNVVPVLVLVIGFTDSMHLVLHVQRRLAGGSSPLEAAQSSIRRLGLACLLTSLSTATGFGSLTMASLDGIRTFGWCCALGSMLSFLAVITVVPLLATTRLSNYVVAAERPSKRSPFGRLPDAMLELITGRACLVLGLGAVSIVVLASFAARLEPDHTLATEIPHSTDVYRALEHLDETFGGMMFAYTVVRWPEGKGPESQEFYDVLKGVHQAIDENDALSNPLSVLSLVQSLPGEGASLPRRAAGLELLPDEILRRFVIVDKRTALVSAHMPDAGARLLMPAFDEMDSRFAEIVRRHPGFEITLTGSSVTVFRNIRLMIDDLWKSLATAAGVMFLMIWIGLRSLRLALVSIVPNLFPLLFTGAVIVLAGRYLEMSSVIVFSISLGIAVDDTIHFLVRYRRERDSGATAPEAVRRTFRVVGTALAMTTVALVAGHGIVLLSAFPAVRVFGMLTAVTLLAALIGDLVILPAMLVCLNRSRSCLGRDGRAHGPEFKVQEKRS